MILDRYDLNTYLLPYWEGNTVYHESVMLLEEADGSLPDVPLLYRASRILSVRSSDLQREYREGTDYILTDGALHIPADSALPRVPHSFYFPPEKTECSKPLNEAYGPGHIFFSEGRRMHDLQIAVTYVHEEPFAGPIPARKAALLPKTTEKLRRGGEMKLCVYGDSICVGANSSAFVNAPPYAPSWPQLLADRLRQQYPGSTVLLQNPSVGGKRSGWGAEEAASRVGYGPDLCIIGFGMNDGSGRIPPEEYQQNIRAIMAAARAGNPDCEFVLLATTLPNPLAGRFLGHQAAYLPMLEALQTEGTAVADMTGFHQYLLSRKRFFDMSGNNVNHPNDFLARAYAQVLWQTAFGPVAF